MSEPLVLPAAFVELIAKRAAELVLEQLGESNGSVPSPWLSLAEAADYLRTSERTVQRMIRRGRVRSSTIGRRRLLHRDDLDALARAATGEDVAPTTPSRHREA